MFAFSIIKKGRLRAMWYTSFIGQDNGDVCIEFSRNDQLFLELNDSEQKFNVKIYHLYTLLFKSNCLSVFFIKSDYIFL